MALSEINPAERLATVVILDSSIGVTGGLRCASRIARTLAPAARTILVVPTNANIGERELTAFSAVVRLPLVQIRKSARNLVLYLPALLAAGWRLRTLLRDNGASALIVNDFFQLQGAVARLFGFRGRIVTWVRFDPGQFPAPLSRFWLWAADRCSDRIVAVSNFIANKLPVSAKICRIYDMVDPDLPDPTSIHSHDRRADIVQIGNYMEHKGQAHALDAFLDLAPDYPDTRLLFYGGDMGQEKNRAYRAKLEERARQSGFGSRIVFNGFTENVAAALNSAAVALNLSRSESFSLTCLEAAQLGVPVVAFRSGGPEEIIIDGNTGFLCDLGDTQAVGRAIRLLLKNPDRASRMGEAAAEAAKRRFGQAEFAQELRKMLDPEPYQRQGGTAWHG